MGLNRVTLVAIIWFQGGQSIFLGMPDLSELSHLRHNGKDTRHVVTTFFLGYLLVYLLTGREVHFVKNTSNILRLMSPAVQKGQ